MANDFLSAFLGDRNRAQALRAFVFNPDDAFTPADLAKRAGVSRIAAARDIKKLAQLDLIRKTRVTITVQNGKRIKASKQTADAWALNTQNLHARAISQFVHEVSPVQYDTIINALRRSGKVSAVILSGTFMGDSTRPADLIVAADLLNERKLETAVRTLEPMFGREIRYAAFSTPEFRYRLTIQDRLIRDTLDFPHLVLLDRTRLL